MLHRRDSFKKRSSRHGEAQEDAKAFWNDLCQLRRYPDLDENGQAPGEIELAQFHHPQEFRIILADLGELPSPQETPQ